MVVLLAMVMIFLATAKYAPLVARFAEVTCAGGSGSARAEGSLGISTAEDKPGIQLGQILGLRRPLVARIWVIRFAYRGHSPRRGERLSWGGRGAFFLRASVISNEELGTMSW